MRYTLAADPYLDYDDMLELQLLLKRWHEIKGRDGCQEETICICQ